MLLFGGHNRAGYAEWVSPFPGFCVTELVRERINIFVSPHVSGSQYESRQLGSADRDRAWALVGNEAQVAEAIHEKTHSGSGCANHFRQLLLTDLRNDLLRF